MLPNQSVWRSVSAGSGETVISNGPQTWSGSVRGDRTARPYDAVTASAYR